MEYPPVTSSAAGPLRVNATRAHGGTHSVSTDVQIDFDKNMFQVWLSRSVCGDTALDLGGKTLSIWTYLEGPEIPAGDVYGQTWVSVNGVDYILDTPSTMKSTDVVNGKWINFSGVVPKGGGYQVQKVQFQLVLNVDGWVGTAHFDDISFEGISVTNRAPCGRYTCEADLVFDPNTMLVWQRYLPMTYAGCTGGAAPGEACSWDEANAYCAQLGMGWRLPSVEELKSIRDPSRDPLIDPSAFPNAPSDAFWSATEDPDNRAQACRVEFSSDKTPFIHKSSQESVRCVRMDTPR